MWFLGEDSGRTGLFHQQLTSKSRRNRCRKWPPLVSVLQRGSTTPPAASYILVHTVRATSTGHAAGFLSSVLAHNCQWYTTYKSSASARASAHVRMTEGVAVPVLLHRSRDTGVQATEHEYLYMAPWGSFDEPFAACVCLISTGGTASSSLHAAF